MQIKESSINKIIEEVIQDDRFELPPNGQTSAKMF